jgi:uncharacterized protein (DUF302 family)
MAAPTISMAGDADGVVTMQSVYPLAETIARLKQDIAAKGIKFFSEINQSKLANDAGIKLRPSVLLVFGNPPLGTQFITAKPAAGLDWPVRLLVFEDEKGQVWTAYSDFGWIALSTQEPSGISNRERLGRCSAPSQAGTPSYRKQRRPCPCSIVSTPVAPLAEASPLSASSPVLSLPPRRRWRANAPPTG